MFDGRIFEGKIGTTKTERSQRSLPIPVALIEQMKKLGDGEWIFRARNGAPINPKNAAKRYIRPVTRELGIPLGGWHDFRHTLSTRLLKRYPTKVVSEILGHANVQTALETYQHVETEDLRAPLNEMANELIASTQLLKEVQDDIWLVSFMDYDLGYFDLETRVLEPLENPFGPKVLPM
jgi:integrase